MKQRTILFLLSVLLTANLSASNNFRTATRAFYLWRCGCAVEADYNGDHFVQKPCHLKDGYMDYVDGTHTIRDGVGGWHDAGDYGKYTVNAAITVANLFLAWEHFQKKIEAEPLSLPETAPGYPEFLKEIKWETDFLLKMQYPDGSGKVSHKLTRKSFSGFIMPDTDDGERYFTEWSTPATADFVAVMAMAARYFKPYDKQYAQQCLDAAKVSWDFLQQHPERKLWEQGDFSTGGYGTSDEDDRLWACAEMFETTGDKTLLKQLEQLILAIPQTIKEAENSDFKKPTGRGYISSDWDWGDVTNLGVWRYAMAKHKGRNKQLLADVRKAIVADAQHLVEVSKSNPYGYTLDKFKWGCNGVQARQAVNLHMADLIAPDAQYQKCLQGIAAYLLGNNVYQRSFVTGLGKNPPLYPHDRRSAADGIANPWPGYLVGGGHTPTDWVDEEADYSRNEIAINWQAGLVYLFASLL